MFRYQSILTCLQQICCCKFTFVSERRQAAKVPGTFANLSIENTSLSDNNHRRSIGYRTFVDVFEDGVWVEGYYLGSEEGLATVVTAVNEISVVGILDIAHFRSCTTRSVLSSQISSVLEKIAPLNFMLEIKKMSKLLERNELDEYQLVQLFAGLLPLGLVSYINLTDGHIQNPTYSILFMHFYNLVQSGQLTEICIKSIWPSLAQAQTIYLARTVKPIPLEESLSAAQLFAIASPNCPVVILSSFQQLSLKYDLINGPPMNIDKRIILIAACAYLTFCIHALRCEESMRVFKLILMVDLKVGELTNDFYELSLKDMTIFFERCEFDQKAELLSLMLQFPYKFSLWFLFDTLMLNGEFYHYFLQTNSAEDNCKLLEIGTQSNESISACKMLLDCAFNVLAPLQQLLDRSPPLLKSRIVFSLRFYKILWKLNNTEDAQQLKKMICKWVMQRTKVFKRVPRGIAADILDYL